MSEQADKMMIYREEEASLSDYLSIIWRRKAWFLATMVAVLVASIGVALYLPPVYQSSASLLVKTDNLTENLFDNSVMDQQPVEQAIEVLIRNVMTKSNLVKLANQYDLFPEQRKNWPEQVLADAVYSKASFKMQKSEIGNISKSKKAQQVLDVSFEYENDPEKAQQVTKALVDLILKQNAEQKVELSAEATNFLESEAERLNKEIEKLDAKITDFKERNQGLLPKQMEFVVSERERTERELLSVEQQIRAVKGTNIQLSGQLAGTNPFIYEDRTLIRNQEGDRVLSATGRLQTLQQEYHAMLAKYSPNHPKVKKIVKEIESLGGDVNQIGATPLTNDNLELAETQLAEARQKYSENHPTVKRLEAKVAALRKEAATGTAISERKDFNTLRRINPAFSSLKASIASGDSELRSLYQRRDNLLQKIDQYTEEMRQGPEVEEKITKLQREHDQLLGEYKEIVNKLTAAKRAKALVENTQSDMFVLIDEPELPIAPVKPNRKAIVALGFLLSIGLAFAVAMLIESLDETITGTRALKKLTKSSPLGTIPVIPGSTDQAGGVLGFGKMAIAGILALVVLTIIVVGMMMSRGTLPGHQQNNIEGSISGGLK